MWTYRYSLSRDQLDIWSWSGVTWNYGNYGSQWINITLITDIFLLGNCGRQLLSTGKGVYKRKVIFAFSTTWLPDHHGHIQHPTIRTNRNWTDLPTGTDIIFQLFLSLNSPLHYRGRRSLNSLGYHIQVTSPLDVSAFGDPISEIISINFHFISIL